MDSNVKVPEINGSVFNVPVPLGSYVYVNYDCVNGVKAKVTEYSFTCAFGCLVKVVFDFKDLCDNGTLKEIGNVCGYTISKFEIGKTAFLTREDAIEYAEFNKLNKGV